MSQQLALPDDTFEELQAVAEAKGLSPEEWIAAKVKEERPTKESDGRPLAEVLAGLVGVIDSSSALPHSGYPDTEFTRGLVEKYERQGLKFTKK